MKLIKIFFLFILLACEACQNDEKVRNDGYIEYEDGSEFLILKLNESYKLPNGNNPLTVSFEDVSDSRCAKSACWLCYGSQADIFLSITDSKGAKVKMNLDIIGCVDELLDESSNNFTDTLGYRFRLVKLSPYPDIEPINKEDYTAKINIKQL